MVDYSSADLSTPTVAFLAELSKTIYNPANGRGVVFDLVHLNDGGAYDNIHGIFRAPVNGVYHFTAQLVAEGQKTTNHYLQIFMMKGPTEIGYIFLDWNTATLKREMAITVRLAKNDDVWIKVVNTGGVNDITGCCFHSIFSGFLLKKD